MRPATVEISTTAPRAHNSRLFGVGQRVKFKLKKGEENTHYYMKSHINSKHKPVVKAWLDESLKRGFTGTYRCPRSPHGCLNSI